MAFDKNVQVNTFLCSAEKMLVHVLQVLHAKPNTQDFG